MRSVRLIALVNRFNHQLNYHSRCCMRSVTVHQSCKQEELLNRAIRNREQREAITSNIKPVNKFRKFPFSPHKFRKYREEIMNTKSVSQIDQILQSGVDFDISVYSAAIKQSGLLQNPHYCGKIVRYALEDKKLIPNEPFYGALFKAFNQNLVPLFSDFYLQQMINDYHIKPNQIILGTLLHGCTKTGDITRATKIWHMMRKVGIVPQHPAYVSVIKTCGQAGDWQQAKMYFNEMINSGINPHVGTRGALFHALIKCSQINEALEIKSEMEAHGEANVTMYVPLISYYLRDADHQDPGEALRLLKECVIVNNLKTLDDGLMNIKHVALLKILKRSDDKYKRKKYFDMIIDAANIREKCGLRAWDNQTATVVFSAYLEYYNYDYKCKDIIECFEKLCKLKMLGYWYYCKFIDKWIIDLHGYGYEQIEFVLNYLINIKSKELIKEMNYEWIFICGKGQRVDPSSKASQTGIKQFVIDKLGELFQVKSCDVEDNPGRIILNKKDIKRYLKKTKTKP